MAMVTEDEMARTKYRPEELWRVAALAEFLGVPRTTLQSAVERGLVPYVVTACGLKLITAEDANAWLAGTPGAGKPRGW